MPNRLGPRRHLSGRQLPGQDRKRPPRDGRRCATWPSASCAWTAKPASPPPSATTPATRSERYAASDCMNDFAVSLPSRGAPVRGQQGRHRSLRRHQHRSTGKHDRLKEVLRGETQSSYPSMYHDEATAGLVSRRATGLLIQSTLKVRGFSGGPGLSCNDSA